jgi:SOS response regulatory protein OraA/RecX
VTIPTVTALRERGSTRVAVELDGSAWRVVPLEAAVRAGLCVGLRLDRERLRRLRRELRSAEADEAAARLLRHREHTVASLGARLADRGFDQAQRVNTVARLAEAGLVDDRRFAFERARRLSEREAGDRMIEADLEAHGVSRALSQEVLADIEPEADRAARIVAKRGSGARTVRRLAARGFAEASLEAHIAASPDRAVP